MIYIHIGAEKTGSTTIQETLKRNRNLFMKSGLTHVDFDSMSFVYSLSTSIGKRIYSMADWLTEIDIEQIFAVISSAYKDTDLVISSEHLQSSIRYLGINGYIELVSAFRKQLPADADFSLIYFVRRYDEYLESLSSESVKANGTLTDLSKIDRHDMKHSIILDIWNREFDFHKIYVNGICKEYYQPKDLIAVFLVCIDRHNLIRTVERPSNQNRRINSELLLILASVSSCFQELRDFRDFVNEYRKSLEMIITGNESLISQDKRDEILRFYNEDHIKISEKYNDGKLLFEKNKRHNIACPQFFNEKRRRRQMNRLHSFLEEVIHDETTMRCISTKIKNESKQLKK